MKISTELRPTQNGPEPRTKPRPAAEPRSGTVAETGRLPKSKAHSAPNGTRIDTPAGGSNPLLFSLVCELLREGREVTVRVEGESMLPLFRSGSRIRIHSLRPEELRRGSVVLGETDSGHFVIHRIVQLMARSSCFRATATSFAGRLSRANGSMGPWTVHLSGNCWPASGVHSVRCAVIRCSCCVKWIAHGRTGSAERCHPDKVHPR